MKRYLPLVLLILLVGVAVFLLMNAPEEKGMHGVKPDISVEAPTLFAEFYNDEAAANEKYLNMVVVVTGTISKVSKNGNGLTVLHLESNTNTGSVKCILDPDSEHNRHEFHRGELVQLKGICSDFYQDVKLTSCVEI